MKRTLYRLSAMLLTLGMLLALTLVPAMAATDLRGNDIIMIAIDPGHGDPETGTANYYGGKWLVERDLNWKIACYLKNYLEENYWNVQVVMTREEGENPKLEDRVKNAADMGCDFVLSLHLNGCRGTDRGALALVPRGAYRPQQAEVSRNVASAILAELEKLGLKNGGFYELIRTYEFYEDTEIPVDAYQIVKHGVRFNIPSIIIEHAYLDNYMDTAMFLSSEEKLQALAIADAKGLEKSLGLKTMDTKPTSLSAAETGDAPFMDVFEDQWFYEDVVYTYHSGLVSGISDDRFAPLDTATRSMVVTLLYRADGTPEILAGNTFPDVETGTWYEQPVLWAAEQGITTGTQEGLFLPEDAVTREQFVTFLYRYAQYKECAVSAEGTLDAFADANTVSPYAQLAMTWAVENQLIQGDGNGYILPQRSLTRGELATLMHRFTLYLDK